MKELKHISYSWIHSFACPYQSFLRYEAGIRSKPTGPLAFGNAIHMALEEAHRKPEFDITFAGNLFLKEFKRILEDDEVFITWPKQKKAEAEGIEILELYRYGIEQGKIKHPPLEVEKEFRIPFEDEIVVVGKIDKVELEDGEYIITDYKSGVKEPDEWFLRHDLQLTTYALACKIIYGKLPKKLVWHHLRNGKLLETTRDENDIKDLETMLHNALQMNRQGIRYRVFHSQICGWCDFAGHGNECEDRELEDKLVAQREALRDSNNTFNQTT